MFSGRETNKTEKGEEKEFGPCWKNKWVDVNAQQYAEK